jgi:hypothetical protein
MNKDSDKRQYIQHPIIVVNGVYSRIMAIMVFILMKALFFAVFLSFSLNYSASTKEGSGEKEMSDRKPRA